jgi:superfamily II DNA or RNA helicase
MKIIVENSISRIEDLSKVPLNVYRDLKDLLSYEIDPSKRHFSKNYRTHQTLLTKRGEFPTGLLYVVSAWLTTNPYPATIKDARIAPSIPSRGIYTLSNYPTLYPEQIEAINACKRLKRGTVVMPTGTGKSLTMLKLVSELNLKTLIVTPNLGLKAQLYETAKKFIVKGVENLTIENIDSPVLPKHTDFDVLIIDEAHHVAAKTYRKLNAKAWSKAYYRFFFTATPFRSRDEEQMLMESVAGQVIYRLEYTTAVAKGYIVPVEAYYVELPKRNEVKGFTWREVYDEIVINNKFRNEIITDLMLRLHFQGKSTLVLVKEIAHGNTLTNSDAFLFANGQDNASATKISSFNSGTTKVLVGTVGILGEGVDTKPCEYVIVAGLGKSKNQFMQNVGRAVRAYPEKESAKVILFKDMSHKWTLTHFKAQCKILAEEYGIKPIKLELT